MNMWSPEGSVALVRLARIEERLAVLERASAKCDKTTEGIIKRLDKHADKIMVGGK